MQFNMASLSQTFTRTLYADARNDPFPEDLSKRSSSHNLVKNNTIEILTKIVRVWKASAKSGRRDNGLGHATK